MEAELRRFILDSFLYGQDNGFSDEQSFLELGIMESTGLLELVNFLECRYSIKVEDADLIPQNLDSISLLAQFVRRKLDHPVTAVRPILQQQTAYSD